MLIFVFSLVVTPIALSLSAGHTERLAAARSAVPAQRRYRRGSNRVPNGAPASARPDLSLLNHVLSVSHDEATVTAEPGVTMEELVAATLPHGLVPKVVPEFRRITVGGAIMGGAMESGSFAHGMFHDTVACCELLLPNGTLAVASRSSHADLLAAIGGSYGSLASLTAATVECIRVPRTLSPPRVQVTFEWHADVAEGVAALTALADDARTREGSRRVDFLDGVALPRAALTGAEGGGGGGGGGSDSGGGGVLVCAASLIDEAAGGEAAGGEAAGAKQPSTEAWSVGAAGAAFYYEELLETRSRLVAAAASAHSAHGSAVGAGEAPSMAVTMPLVEYLFRFDRGAFQVGEASLIAPDCV